MSTNRKRTAVSRAARAGFSLIKAGVALDTLQWALESRGRIELAERVKVLLIGAKAIEEEVMDVWEKVKEDTTL